MSPAAVHLNKTNAKVFPAAEPQILVEAKMLLELRAYTHTLEGKLFYLKKY